MTKATRRPGRPSNKQLEIDVLKDKLRIYKTKVNKTVNKIKHLELEEQQRKEKSERNIKKREIIKLLEQKPLFDLMEIINLLDD